VIVRDTRIIGHTDSICSELLDSTPISSPLPPTTASYVHAFHEFLGDIIGCFSSFGPYCAYLEDVPRKIMWSPFFGHAFEFFLPFHELKRSLTLFASSFLVFSYSRNSEMHVITYNKLLRALTSSKSRTQVLSDMEEWLILLEPHVPHFSEA